MKYRRTHLLLWHDLQRFPHILARMKAHKYTKHTFKTHRYVAKRLHAVAKKAPTSKWQFCGSCGAPIRAITKPCFRPTGHTAPLVKYTHSVANFVLHTTHTHFRIFMPDIVPTTVDGVVYEAVSPSSHRLFGGCTAPRIVIMWPRCCDMPRWLGVCAL